MSKKCPMINLFWKEGLRGLYKDLFKIKQICIGTESDTLKFRHFSYNFLTIPPTPNR